MSPTELRERDGLIRLRALLPGGGFSLAIFDQAVVSGCNFLTTIVLVRALGAQAFGLYAVGYAVLLYVNELQRSFVISPMLSLGAAKANAARQSFLSSMLVLQLCASAIAAAAVLSIGVVAHSMYPMITKAEVASFALCAATFQLQDWVRRVYFLLGVGRLALICDAASYIGQIVVLSILWRTGHLDVNAAFAAIGVTSLLASCMLVFTHRFAPQLRAVRATWQECRKLSCGLTLTSQARWLGSQGLILIGSRVIGMAEVGGVRAVQGLSGPAYLVLASFENVLPLRIGAKMSRATLAEMNSYLRTTLASCSLLLIGLVLPVAIWVKPILRFLYGPDLVRFSNPVLLQLLGIILAGAFAVWGFFFRGLNNTEALVRATLLAAATNLLLVYPLARTLGASGIVLCYVAGQFVALLYCFRYWHQRGASMLALRLTQSEHVGEETVGA